MLNKDNIRELAYVVKVNDIIPHPNADRLDIAIINGWRCIVGKGDFKPGDLAVYFEIDSQLPDTEPFHSMEFLASKHFKIKSQKIRGEISQGLLMPITELPISNGVKEGDFLTEKLGVTYAVTEDNKRKAASVDKYKKMAQRHPELAKTKWWRTMYKSKIGRNILFILFGKKKDKRTWPAWVVKTDEERCLPGATKILTEQGWIQISKIVNQHLKVKVASMDENGMIVYKNIADYQKFNNTDSMITIRYPYAPDCTRSNALCCTRDHRIYTQRGYILAKEVKETDMVYMPVNTYSEDVLPIIYGMLLGDSHIANDKRSNGMLRIVTTNGEKQLDYLNYKYNIFNNGKIVNAGIGSFDKVPSYHWFLDTDAQISVNVRKDWLIDNKKTVTYGVCNKITPISLAFWYMDDGCLTYRNSEKTAYFIRLNTQGFSLEENNMLVDILINKFNVKAKVNKDKIAEDGHQMYRIDISSTEESNNFLQLIAPYICDSMLYKLPPQMQNRKLIAPIYKKDIIAFPVPVLSIENGQTKNKSWSKTFKVVYDLEIEDTHNFIADNIVVHNCQNMPWILNDKEPWIATEKIDGTSTTFTMIRKKKLFKEEFDFYVCSRNVVFDTPEKMERCYYDENYYLQMAKKYDVENILKCFLCNNPEVEWATLQGETYGNGVQKRDYSLKDVDFKGFNFITSTDGRWDSVKAAKYFDGVFPWVPILDENFILPNTVEELLEMATGKSTVDGLPREGIVFRSKDGKKSFKAVSNEYLLRYHN